MKIAFRGFFARLRDDAQSLRGRAPAHDKGPDLLIHMDRGERERVRRKKSGNEVEKKRGSEVTKDRSEKT